MIPYLGDFAEDETVYIYFNTFSSDDPSASVTVTDLVAADIFVYKDGSVTDIVTDGASVTIDFDSRTGLHKIEIDTSAHADYTIGSDYMVMVNGITVDAGTLNAAVACFSIENRYNAAADDLANGTDGLGAIKAETALILADTNELQTDDVPGLIATLDAVVDTVKAETALIVADTNELQTNQGNWLTATGFATPTNITAGTITTVTNLTNAPTNGDLTATMKASVNTEVDNSMVTYGLDHLISSALPTNWATDVASGSVFDNIADDGTAAYDRTTDSLQAVRDHVGDGTNLTEAGGDGDHLSAIPGSSDPWSTALPGAYGAGTAGEILGDWKNGGRLDLLLDAIPTTPMRGTDNAATSAKQDTMETTLNAAATSAAQTTAQNDLDIITGADGVNLLSATQASIDAIEADTNELQTDDIPAAIAALNDLAGADILTQVNAALDTAISELGVAAPTATPTIRTALMLQYMALRNKRTTTATADTIANDAGTTIATSTLSDDTVTFTKGEYT